MKFSIGAKLAVGFGSILVLVITVGFASNRGVNQLLTSSQWVAHTHLVQSRLIALLSTVQDGVIGERGFAITGDATYLQPYTDASARVDDEIQALKALVADNPEQEKRLERVTELIHRRMAILQEVNGLRRDKGFDAARAAIESHQGQDVMDELRGAVHTMENTEIALQHQRDVDAQASADLALTTIKLGCVASIILVLVAGWSLTRHIGTPLRTITDVAEKITAGQLAVSISPSSRADELGALLRTFSRMLQSLQGMAQVAERIAAGDLRVNVLAQSDHDVLGLAFVTMVHNLRTMNQELQSGVNVLAGSASEILAGTAQIASGTTETAAAIAETSSTVEEIKQTAHISSQKAKYVSEMAQKAAQVSQSGRHAVDDVSDGMQKIHEQMELIADAIMRLSEQTQAIGEIIATVNELAEQSNLLAVNASIEAAKAGEQGKGFVVVAQEVKSLAQQSKQATVQVRGILGEIQKATSGAVLATEQGSKAVEAGMKQSVQAGDAIRLLAENIVDSAQAAAQIAVSAQQQLAGMDQLVIAMGGVRDASAQNINSSRQAELAARNLHELGQTLKAMAARFQL